MAKNQATKSTQKNSSFFSKLVPRTRKSQFVVFLVVFALIGGGVMAYRSFAAGGFGIYTASQLERTDNYSGSKFRLVTETYSGKAKATVLELDDGSVQLKKSLQPTVWAPYVRFCVNASVPSGNNLVPFHLYTSIGNNTGSSSKQGIRGKTYQKFCAPWARHTQPEKRIGGYIVNYSGSKLRIASVSIEYTN